MADGDVLVLTGGHQSFSAISELASSLPRLRGFAVNAATTYTSGTVILSAGANITLGTNGQTVTISGNAAAVAQSVQSQNMVAISASDALFSSGTVVLTGAGAATVNTAAGSIRVSVPVQSAQTQNVAVLSASNSVFTSGTVVLSGAYGVTVGTGAQTIYISGPMMSSWQHNSAGWYSATSLGQTNASASFLRMDIPAALTFTRLDVPVRIVTASSATAATAAAAFSNIAVLYTRNDSTLNPIVGASNTVTISWVSNSGIASSATGLRLLSFALASSLTPGVYWLGLHISSTSGISQTAAGATTALDATMNMHQGNMIASLTASGWHDIMLATNATINGLFPLQGLVSSAITATNQTIQQSQITQTGAALQRANLIVNFRG